MGRATASGKAATNRSDAIVHEALRLFAERGLHAASMRDIALAVGLTEGTLYHYYASKADIVAAIVERTFFSADEVSATLADNAERSLSEQLLAIADWFYAALNEYRVVTAFFMSEASRLSPDSPTIKLAARFAALFRGRVERLALHLAKQKPGGDPRLLAAHFFDSLGGFWIMETIVAKKAPSAARWRSYAESIVGLIVANCASTGAAGSRCVRSKSRRPQWRTKW